LKIEIHRVGVSCLFRASRLGADELRVKRVGKPRDDFVLHVEEIGKRLVEAVRPKVTAALGVKELDIHSHSITAALNASLQRVANAQLAADSPHVDRLALECEGCAASDHEGASDPRKVCSQAVGHPIDEIVLLGIAADVGERQDDNGEPRQLAVFGRGRFAFGRDATR
jgi:hypothetical protein